MALQMVILKHTGHYRILSSTNCNKYPSLLQVVAIHIVKTRVGWKPDAGMGKFFDELLLAEEQKEAQSDD